MERTFGIIGGMGPMATELFYKMLIEKTVVSCDQGHLNTIILGHALSLIHISEPTRH